MFCNDILFELVLVRLKDDRRRGEFVALFAQYKHVCTKWSFAVSIVCLAHHAGRLWCSPRRWPCVATNPVQIRWKSHVSFPHSWGRRASLEKTLSLRALDTLQRARYTLERAWHTLKRAPIYTQKSPYVHSQQPLHTLKRTLFTLQTVPINTQKSP